MPMPKNGLTLAQKRYSLPLKGRLLSIEQLLIHGWHCQVIITSFLFPGGRFSQERLDAVLQALGGDKSKLVIDLSCRRQGEKSWCVAMNKWQTLTDMEVNQG